MPVHKKLVQSRSDYTIPEVSFNFLLTFKE